MFSPDLLTRGSALGSCWGLLSPDPCYRLMVHARRPAPSLIPRSAPMIGLSFWCQVRSPKQNFRLTTEAGALRVGCQTNCHSTQNPPTLEDAIPFRTECQETITEILKITDGWWMDADLHSITGVSHSELSQTVGHA